jgi:lysophospholipase L1-like esterase
MLTDQQCRHFNTFGFVVLRKVFTDDDLALINKELSRAMETGYQHDPFDGSTLLGEDFDECTVDGVHPTDLGFMRMARGLAPEIERMLGG